MNSVSPAATQYGSPEGRRRRNLSGRHDPPQMGYQGAGRDRATDEVDKIKSKLQTAWNSVKYGWTVKMKTQFSRSTPLILLSKHYYFGYEDWSWPEALNTLFVEMEPLRSSSPHSLPSFSSISSPVSPSSHLYCRSTSCPSKPHVQNPHQEHIHRDILRWLSDCPDAPFGLHHMVKLGGSLGKKAGDWYGPSIVAHIVRKALETSPQVPELSVYVSQDCTVYRADVEQLLGTDGPVTDVSNTGRAVIILIPVRLGGESFNPVYKQCIKEFLQMPACVGIIGGKPKHSLYFIGYQDNHLLYLDPHYCQAHVDTSKADFPLDTFHCNSPRKMSIVKMDPSCTIAFYARNRAEFGALCDHVTKVLSSPSAEEKYPVFSIAEGHAQEFHVPEVLPRSSYPLAHRSRGTMPKRPSSDEFEFL
ncbi:cysteine protease ATG4D isoform X2 [Ranitomeya imitator]|uniref:cysteine protease ATG4D isoform X2 n=1 Tax=Ranitomeya imitator TaxID=111125 RepID=UPI0037E88644